MSLLPVEDAKTRILAGARPLPIETVAIAKAAGRVLARDLKARRDQPPHAVSAMDGYAVRAEDVTSCPVDLDIIGEAPAGREYRGRVGKNQAVRLFTGALVPKGADTIVIQENTRRDGSRVTVLKSAGSGQFVRPAGLDFSKGETVLKAGTWLGGRMLGLAAAMNYPELPVRRKPQVAVLATGDELVPPGSRPRKDQIISSNSLAISTLITQFGGISVDLGIAPDDLAEIAERIQQAKDADVLITIGGASVGEHDLVHDALISTGVNLGFWKIAMRPGKPLMFGRRGRQRILGLPGNPVSALVCSKLFLEPLIAALLGHDLPTKPVVAQLTSDLPANDHRQDHLRARLHRDGNGLLTVNAYGKQDSSMQRTLAEADALVIRTPHAPAAKAGDTVEVLPIDF